MICILYYIAPSLSQPNVCLSTKWLHTCYFRRKSFTTRRVYSLTLYSSFHSPHGPCYLARFEPFVEPQGQPTLFMVRYMVVSLGHLAISDIASFYVSFLFDKCPTNQYEFYVATKYWTKTQLQQNDATWRVTIISMFIT